MVRYNNEPTCYGWNNESYFSDPPWRNPNRVLEKGQYLVKVTVSSLGQRVQKVFVLNNQGTRSDFRLSLSGDQEQKKVLAASTT